MHTMVENDMHTHIMQQAFGFGRRGQQIHDGGI